MAQRIDLSSMNVGDLFYDESSTHDGKPNVIRIERIAHYDGDPHAGERRGVYAIFVNPADPSQLRQADDREFFRWDSEIERRGGFVPFKG